MNHDLFEQIVAEEFDKAIPERFQKKLQNVVLLVEDEPSEEVRRDEKLGEHETLLGLYKGVALTARGGDYGIGLTLPDTITIYRLPILEEVAHEGGGEEGLRKIIRETIWHEIAHYFGFDEGAVRKRERKGTNRSF